MLKPSLVELINGELCVAWPDGEEAFFTAPFLRKNSPSAENKGEVDILGVKHGGTIGNPSYDKVSLVRIERVGNYGIRPVFSDGHSTGIFSWALLKELAKPDPGKESSS